MRHLLTTVLITLLATCCQRPAYPQITATGSGSQSITLKSPTPISCPPASATVVCTAPAPTIQLPIEVFGPAGTTASVTVDLASTPPPGTVLWLQVHGVRYSTEASVQVNNSIWLPLSTAGVTVLGPAAAYGGIGGGFATFAMTVALPAGALTSAGANTISFKFDQSDGISSGFRVLALNLQSGGANLVPASMFVETNPATWLPPLNDPADIAAGLVLFQTAALTDTATGVTTALKAHCSDCHAVDGRDLKYFNYSNLAITSRATFHGLSAQQGQQIASYIRSLTTPSPGLPWNPPYQPGAGMDTVPVANWSAGAGLAAVLAGDSALAPFLTNMAATAYLNPRTTPLPLQLPDWNSWLPKVWPGDAYGATFTAGAAMANYQLTRTQLAPGTPAAYKNSTVNAFTAWIGSTNTLLASLKTAASPNWMAVTSVQQWRLVKQWELNQDFGLEAMASAVFPKANPRAWFGAAAFSMEPVSPKTSPGFMNGLLSTWEYMDNAWNFLQFVLNDGQGAQSAGSPIDYSYVEGDVKDLSGAAGVAGASMELYVLTKALQENTLIGMGPQGGYLRGFAPQPTSPYALANEGFATNWVGYAAATQTALTAQFAQAWINQVSTYTPAEFYAGTDGNGRPWAQATENCANKTTDPLNVFGGQLWYNLPRLRTVGVPAATMTQIYAFVAKLFPGTNWKPSIAATCNASLSSCTSDSI